MPRFDGTGPNGYGSKTGRGLGQCNTNEDKKTYFGVGRSLRRGCEIARRYGNGRGYRLGRGFGIFTPNNNYNDVDDKNLLQEEKQTLQERLKYIEDRINKLGEE
ncbi:DUF5320 domain-containing protein [Clostridium aestuarii]|uniref:DUF5320 domain-containing protein n=1 Tax=Clostridium aestuarii TaxID=338193 RepID=A0ABT4D269_9CLOT|nr:DUF5320 domain-containing protein [Clostridium aestuarii]MCY6485343.1 DUF5320 domain-containing protein [Clostridium aestuarii]